MTVPSARAEAPSRRRAATQQRLLDAARAVFAERGVNAATVEDICETAGFTRGAFYSNFASKDDLLVAIVAEERHRFLDAVARAVNGFDGSAPLDRMIEDLVQIVLNDRPLDRAWALLQAELTLHAARMPHLADALTLQGGDFLDRIEEFVVLALGRAGRRPVVPAAEVTLIIVSLCQAGMLRELARPPAEWTGMLALAPVLAAAITALSGPAPAG